MKIDLSFNIFLHCLSYSDNYPETLRKVVIVNVPTVFSMIWSGVQYLWDAKQVAKFQFVCMKKENEKMKSSNHKNKQL